MQKFRKVFKIMSNKNVDRDGVSHKAHLFWIHCNRCFELYIRKRRHCFLLACQHVVCANCLTPVTPAHSPGGASCKCPICDKKVRACQMGNRMPSHLKALFNPQPYRSGSYTTHIMRFQHRQRKHFHKGMDKMHTKLTKLKTAFEKEHDHIQALFMQRENLRRERIQYEKSVRLIIEQRQLEKEEQRKLHDAQCHMEQKLPTPSTTDDSFNQPLHSQNHPRRRGFGRGIPSSAPHYGNADQPTTSSPNSTMKVTSFASPPRPNSFTF